jgi:hypothetical protein
MVNANTIATITVISSDLFKMMRFNMPPFSYTLALALGFMVLRAAASGSGLVDLLLARRLVRAPNRDVRARFIELEVTRSGTVLKDIDRVLGIAGVGYEGGREALVGVVARTRALKRLVDFPALGILLGLLAYPVLGVAGVGTSG